MNPDSSNTPNAGQAEPDDRFAFGKNWRQFLRLLDDERITAAETSLRQMLCVDDLEDMSFLDIGSGSGLFSLAARRLGSRVHSLDLDPQSVACTAELKRRYFPEDETWRVETASILDDSHVQQLGPFDIVYSWGVLHHTGSLWQAVDNAASLVRPDGRLCISIYNDQGGASRRWRLLKRFYNRSPRLLRLPIVLAVGAFFETRSGLIRLLRLQNPLPFKDWAAKKKDRGMSAWYDLVDWVGGYPFEVAKPEEVFRFLRKRGFELTYLTTQGSGHGCNEFTFVRRQG